MRVARWVDRLCGDDDNRSENGNLARLSALQKSERLHRRRGGRGLEFSAHNAQSPWLRRAPDMRRSPAPGEFNARLPRGLFDANHLLQTDGRPEGRWAGETPGMSTLDRSRPSSQEGVE